jgi:hypothetical protein
MFSFDEEVDDGMLGIPLTAVASSARAEYLRELTKDGLLDVVAKEAGENADTSSSSRE